MVERKTKQTKVSVKEFLAGVKNETRRKDGTEVARMMRKASGKQAKMWGPSIIGFGKSEYSLAGGKTGEICRIGFSPRAQSLVFYLGKFKERERLLKKLGKHKTGNGGCIYINKLADVDTDVLQQMIVSAYQEG